MSPTLRPCSMSLHPTQPNLFVSGGCDTLAKVWDVRVRKCIQTFAGHENDINAVQYVGPRSACTHCTGLAWVARSNPGTVSLREWCRFLPSGDGFGTASDDSSCRIFDLRSDRELVQFTDDSASCGVTYVFCPLGSPCAAPGSTHALRARTLMLVSHRPGRVLRVDPQIVGVLGVWPDRVRWIRRRAVHRVGHAPAPAHGRAHRPREPRDEPGRCARWQRRLHRQLGHGPARTSRVGPAAIARRHVF